MAVQMSSEKDNIDKKGNLLQDDAGCYQVTCRLQLFGIVYWMEWDLIGDDMREIDQYVGL